jgi:hypothetical protein
MRIQARFAMTCLKGLLVLAAARHSCAAIYYVATNGNDSAAGTNWATAKATIQAAIDLSVSNDTVLVSNGVYATGGRIVYGAMTNRVAITKAIMIRSINGPTVTTIKGSGPRGNAAVRCVYVGANATLSGFTLTNGATRASGDDVRERSGGGAWCESSGVLSTCTLSGNSADVYGGGSYSGTLSNCTLSGNSADYGGGSYSATLNNCILSGNSAFNYGGGSYYSTLNNCTLSSNSAFGGGGSSRGTLNNCTLSGNSADWGGGSYSGTLSNCTVSGNSAYQYGGGSCYGTLYNCTLSGNSATNYGGGSSGGTLDNCTLSGNWANWGGGSYSGTLYNCTLSGNWAKWGGGSYSGTLHNCTLSGNWAKWGGGSYDGTLNHCTLSGNSADYGGGSSSATLNNCILSGNSATNYGGGSSGGTLDNCTLSGNWANWGGGSSSGTLYNCTLSANSANWGGGSYRGTLNNCIVFFNVARSGPNYSGSTFRFSCTTPVPGGTGNITNEPKLASASHLATGSPCIGAGSSAYAVGTDLDGDVWRSPPSMGCDELVAGSATGALSVSAWSSHTNVAVGFSVEFRALISGRTTASVWHWGDGQILSNRPFAAHAFASNGTYAIALTACNDSYPLGIMATVTVQVAEQNVHHVSADSPTPVSPYTSWATAATNIQDAIDVATQDGALVLVSNGVYSAGGRVVYGAMTNRVAITNAIEIRSVNGPTFATIEGSGPRGNAAVRCVYVGANAMLSGFTLTNGATRISGDSDRETRGGGAWCERTGVLSNCTLSGNSANLGGGSYDGTLNNCTLSGNSAGSGGGSQYSTLSNCTLSGNSAYWGGGSYDGTLNNCTLFGNSATNYGGGAYDGTLNNCTLSGNSADGGGGSSGGTLNNCTLSGNSAYRYGGGSSSSTLYNCTLSGNWANWAGGSYDGTLNNCTLSGNSATYYGGGSFGGTLDNCMLSGNWAKWGGGSYDGTLNNCTLSGNSADYGGGSSDATLNNCTLSGNSASGSGGGSSYGTLNNCMLSGNSATNGGGLSYGTLNNCTLSGNSAYRGGGSYVGTLNNCTVSANSATNYGGGSYGGTLNNCIVFFNAAPTEPNYSGSTFHYSCTTPAPGGTSNITNEPLFVAANNVHLAAGSPCIDRGINYEVQGTTDLDGHPRIVNGTVDMGAYEYQGSAPADSDGDGLPDAWELQYFGSLTNLSFNDDWDGDGCSDAHEFVSGTDPIASNSHFEVVGVQAQPTGGGIILRWTSASNRTYSVYCATNLGEGFNTLLQGNLPGLPPENTYTDPVPAIPTRSYGIEVRGGP